MVASGEQASAAAPVDDKTGLVYLWVSRFGERGLEAPPSRVGSRLVGLVLAADEVLVLEHVWSASETAAEIQRGAVAKVLLCESKITQKDVMHTACVCVCATRYHPLRRLVRCQKNNTAFRTNRPPR